MKIDNSIKSIIDDIQAGKLNEYLKQIDNSDFGLYVPLYEEHGIIKPIPTGYSQTERNLVVSIERKIDGSKARAEKRKVNDKTSVLEKRRFNDRTATLEKRKNDDLVFVERKVNDPKASLVVGWFGRGRVLGDVEDSTCNHKSVCTHCSHCSHSEPAPTPTTTCDHRTPGGPQVICLSHPNPDQFNTGSTLGWPMLDYHKVAKQIDDMQDLLNSLAVYGVGLNLLHGHSDKFMFTKLPEGYVSVIANGITSFRKEGEVTEDKTFVPNMWRSINGKLHVAGGYSQIDAK